jgi:elongator complex protein 1
MIAYEKALSWRELFDIAIREDFSSQDLKDMAYRVSGSFHARDVGTFN